MFGGVLLGGRVYLEGFRYAGCRNLNRFTVVRGEGAVFERGVQEVNN